MIDKPRLLQTDARETVVIHLSIPRSDMRKEMGPAISDLIDTLGTRGIFPAGPTFAHHFKIDPDIFDFEIGFPVDKPISPAGRVISSQLTVRKVARTVYHGPYEGLPFAWEAFMSWIEEEGLTPASDLWEIYLDYPDLPSDPARFQTELNRPLIEE